MTDFYSEQYIEDVILKHSKRGMNILRKYMDVHFCGQAARDLLETGKGTVFIITGFYVARYAETDGPLGAYFLALALRKIGYRPVIITDSYCEGFFDDELEVVYLPIRHDGDIAAYEELMDRFGPSALISIERCGRTADNDYRNMRGISIKEHTSPIDRLFDIAAARSIFTIGIGDGGNEIGMGNLREVIEEKLELTPCTVGVDRLILSTVSNWGAYGLIAYLQAYTGQALLPSFRDVEAYLSKIIAVGSVDGVTKEKTLSVDGFDLSYEKEILESISDAMNRLSFNRFTMSEEYSDTSLSQFDIGRKVIGKMKEYVLKGGSGKTGSGRESISRESTGRESAGREEPGGGGAGAISVLDIGCGPGNLTYELYKSLNAEQAVITAVDIDENAIKRAKRSYEGIAFKVRDLYSGDWNTDGFDYLFSNETLHWMPKLPEAFYQSEGIIYYFFEKDLQEQYREWARNCYRRSFRNIYGCLKPRGIAFLQFGLDGQLKKVYELLNRVMLEHYPDQARLYKLPLYYPTARELEEICREEGFELLERTDIREELSEDSPGEITGFLKGFMENSLCLLLGKEKTAKLFEIIYNELGNLDLKKFSENQWNHTIVVVTRQ